EQIQEKYNELQREYDEQKDILVEVKWKEKEAKIALQKSLKERQILLKRLETTELEVLQIENLKDKLKEVTNERVESWKKNAELVEKLEKKHNECESLLISIINLKETNDNLRNNYETRENVIKMLRENNRQLEEENTELKLLKTLDTRTSIVQFPKTAHSDGEYCTMHDSLNTVFDDSTHQDSLYDELKASGFANMCSWNNTLSYELKKEVECSFQQLVLGSNEKCVNNIEQNLTENSDKTNNLETLRQRIQILLDTVNAKLLKAGIEVGIQVQIQNSSPRKNLYDLSTLNSKEDRVECFSKKNQIITSYDDFSDGNQDKNQEPFTKTMKSPKVVTVSETRTIDPIVQILHKNVRPIKSSHRNPRKKSTKNIRSLNNSSDSSISTSSLQSENQLLDDVSLDELEHCLYQLQRPVQMAPMKLKLPLNKAMPFSKETIMDTQGNFNAKSNNSLIDNTKSECNLEPKQYQITENVEEGCSINKDCNIVSSDDYLNDTDNEIYLVNGETYLIDKSIPNRYDKTPMYFTSFSNVDQESGNTEIHLPTAYSTPMRVNSKDKNLFKMKHRNDQSDNNESLVRQFANLKMTKTKMPISGIDENHLKEMKTEDEWIQNVDGGNKNNTLSISFSNLEKVAFANKEKNSSEYSVIKIAQKNNKEESINHGIKSDKKIAPTSLDDENQTLDTPKELVKFIFILHDILNYQELRDLQNETQFRKDLVGKVKKKSLLEEIFQFKRSNSTKLNIRNDKVIRKETELR
ncbi:hypothetical protein M0802_005956, partial [Mischocyttarus mexicanus]